MGLNVCIVCGRMGGDPEFRQTQGGNPVSNFSIACDRDYKIRTGQSKRTGSSASALERRRSLSAVMVKKAAV